VSCTFGGVVAWLQWAKLPGNRFYFAARNPRFAPDRGDLVVYDRVLHPPCQHDHIGIVLEVLDGNLRVAEGNVGNVSAVVTRERNSHVRGHIRIPNDYVYCEITRDQED